MGPYHFGMSDYLVAVDQWLAALGMHPLFPAVSVFVATLIGGLVAWFVAQRYYKRSVDDLRQEADQLHRAVDVVLGYLANQGANVEVKRDSNGRTTGLIVNAEGHAEAAVAFDAVAASVTATPATPEK
jgi:hypothetical protein